MKTIFRQFFLALTSALVGWLLIGAGTRLQAADLTQALNLQAGWNAVWLEVEPRDAEGSLMTAGDVFADAAIDKVAIQSLPVGTAEFSTDPEQLSNQEGWLVWSRTPASGQSDTILMRGNHAYLVHATSPLTLTVQGRVEFYRPRLELGSYNLMGFSVSPNGGPTFESLLGPGGFRFESLLQDGSPIKRLDGGTNWVDVLQTEQVKAGEAYWVRFPLDFHAIDYASPVAVSFTGWQQGGLDFGSAAPSVTVTNPFDNFSAMGLSPAELTFSSLEPDGGPARSVKLTKLSDSTDEDILLFHVERVPNQLAWQTDPVVDVLQNWTLDPLGPDESRSIILGLYRNWASEGYYREQLYRIEVQLDGGSAYYYLPVSAVNFDADPLDAGTTDGSRFAGLWVGTVTAESVTSLTETASPVNPTASRAQLRMLIHVDTNGVPVLLSHVMRMQTKTADPSVAPEEVLILDEAQIPYYEGILERGGKKVGIRYETVAFDMPRDSTTPGAQSDEFLLAVYDSEGGITDGDVTNYLGAQESRPPELKEVYYDSWPLGGVFGPGNVIQTGENPLQLDAFHRTNPFRHAYHPQHGAGYTVTRHLKIALDEAYQTGSDRLTGTYQETTSGLSTQDLEAHGTLVLRRASFVDQLQR